MAKDKARKTLYYVRAVNGSDAVNLKTLIVKARTKFPTVADSELEFGAQDIIRIQHYRETTAGVFLHLVRYVPGEKASTLLPKSNRAEDNEGSESAPAGKEFKDGDSFIFANKGNVIFCSHGISIQKTSLYLSHLFKKAGFEKAKRQFELKPASKIDKLKLIQSHGVRAIHISCSAFQVSLPKKERTTWMSKTLGNIGDEMKALIEKDETASEQKAMEDLIVDVEIRLDGNTRAIASSQEFIEDVAESVLDDNSELASEFTIVTKNGERITSAAIRLQSSLDVTKSGRSVVHYEVWEGLESYMSDIKQGNLLEQ